MTVNLCGTCTMCCKLPPIPELNKPAATWCKDCDKGKGCKIYDTRPKGCADFTCMWLATQKTDREEGRMPASLRPDKSKVVLAISRAQKGAGGPFENVLSIWVDPAYPSAWKTEAIQHEIGELHRWQPNLPVLLTIGNVSKELDIFNG